MKIKKVRPESWTYFLTDGENVVLIKEKNKRGWKARVLANDGLGHLELYFGDDGDSLDKDQLFRLEKRLTDTYGNIPHARGYYQRHVLGMLMFGDSLAKIVNEFPFRNTIVLIEELAHEYIGEIANAD